MDYLILYTDDQLASELRAHGLAATPLPQGMVITIAATNLTLLRYDRIRDYVRATPELAPYEATIFYDWPNMNDHLAWAATADVDAIASWARHVESGMYGA